MKTTLSVMILLVASMLAGCGGGGGGSTDGSSVLTGGSGGVVEVGAGGSGSEGGTEEGSSGGGGSGGVEVSYDVQIAWTPPNCCVSGSSMTAADIYAYVIYYCEMVSASSCSSPDDYIELPALLTGGVEMNSYTVRNMAEGVYKIQMSTVAAIGAEEGARSDPVTATISL